MEPINNADRLVLLLRQKLEERAKAGTTARAGAKTQANTVAPAEASGVRALAALEGADERALRRAVVQNLLADQLEPQLLNDAQFQQIVSRVTDAIEDDPDAAKLLSRVIAELRLS
jgi:DNA-binding TFAR19-related protein (PDSD5 family)